MDAPERSTPLIDVNTIRKANLRRLIIDSGSVREFADRIGSDPNYISSIVATGGTRNAGDKLMRKVEEAFKLPPGSLDFPEEKSIAAAMAIQSLPAEEQQQVFDFLRYKIQSTAALTAKEHAASYLIMIDNLKTDMAKRRGKK